MSGIAPKTPAISVVMGAYNAEKYLKDSLESIINQTFTDWECILVDDGSHDGTLRILSEYAAKDKRFKLLKNETNSRLAASLNRGIAVAVGKYIVRTDADDICLPERFERQYEFMETHPDIGVASTKFFYLGEKDGEKACKNLKGDPEIIRAMLLFSNPIFHPGVIARRKLMLEFPYDTGFTCTEDLELWLRMVRNGVKIAVMDDYLMRYRLHAGQISVVASDRQKDEYKKIISSFYRDMLFALSGSELEALTDIIYLGNGTDTAFTDCFFEKVTAANTKLHRFSKNGLRLAILDKILSKRAQTGNGQTLVLLMKHCGIEMTVRESLRRRIRKSMSCKKIN